MTLWLDGRLLPDHAARINPADRGLLLGDGLFETVRAIAGMPLHFARHLARLRAGAATLGMALAWPDDALAEAARTVLAGQDGALRLTLTRGPAPRGLLPPAGTRPTMLITAAPLPPPLPPARAIVAAATRRNEHSPLSRIKSLNYLDSILARQEAAARGADEAILLNTAGDVAEASAGNLFVLLAGAWTTPPTRAGALPGITRARLLEAGLAQEARLTVADLALAEAIFLSSSLGLRALASLDDRALRPPDLGAQQRLFDGV